MSANRLERFTITTAVRAPDKEGGTSPEDSGSDVTWPADVRDKLLYYRDLGVQLGWDSDQATGFLERHKDCDLRFEQAARGLRRMNEDWVARGRPDPRQSDRGR